MIMLSSIEEKDLDLILEWRNSANVRWGMLNDHLITWEEHYNWFKKLKNKSDQNFLVCRMENKPIGVVAFNNIDMKNKHCKWGFYIGEPSAPKGAGTLMAYHAIQYVFEKYHLHKINSEVIDFNKISLNFHRKLGFFQTGIWKEDLLRDNVFYDLIILSLFKEYWDKVHEEIYFDGLNHVKGGDSSVRGGKPVLE